MRWREAPAAAWAMARAHSWVPAPLGVVSAPYAVLLTSVLLSMRRDAFTATSDAGARLVLVLEPFRPHARGLLSRLLTLAAAVVVAALLAVALARVPPAVWAVLQGVVAAATALTALELVPQVARGLLRWRTQRSLQDLRQREQAWLLHWVSAWPRGTGLGDVALADALARLPAGQVVVLSTRTARLRLWYEQHGFTVADHPDGSFVMRR